MTVRHPNIGTRREFVFGLSFAGMIATDVAAAPQDSITRLIPGPEVDNYKKAQALSLARFKVSAQSRFVNMPKLSLTAHVLEAGRGDPVVLIHGGGAKAVQFAPMLAPLQKNFHTFAPDRPGCAFDNVIPYRPADDSGNTRDAEPSFNLEAVEVSSCDAYAQPPCDLRRG